MMMIREETPEQAELNKCVDCCKQWVDVGTPQFDLCNECFDQVRVHLPIPPMCLDLDTEDHPSIVTLSHPYEHSMHHALNQSINQTVKEAGERFDKTFITGNGEMP